jgi:hypothetical protein
VDLLHQSLKDWRIWRVLNASAHCIPN